MSELLPCPFCGGEARCYPSDAFNEGGSFEFVVQCNSMDNHTLVNDYQTEAEAIEAWNTRAEQTCENITDNKRANQFECSKCHCIVEDAENYYVNVYERGKLFNGNTYGWDYCPNCGRRVINNDN